MSEHDNLGFKPLYSQVKSLFIQRIADGVWESGVMIPSENVLAAELKVSQGTVRKALDEMTAQNMLTRRQGVGTFVAKHDEERILFQFFKLQPKDNSKAFPESEIISNNVAPSTLEEQSVLQLNEGDEVIRLKRIRMMNGVKALIETIILPAKMYVGLENSSLPNNLYSLFSAEYGVAIGRASEKITAVLATDEEARLLDIAPNSPLLHIDRVAITVDDNIAEWRVSSCTTQHFHYVSDLR